MDSKRGSVFYYDSPIGKLSIRDNSKAIISISVLPHSNTTIESKEELYESHLIKDAYSELAAYFLGNLKTFSLPIEFIGTEFQKKVWKALQRIPYGETRTYKDIAHAIGNQKSCRAVGGANNKNPLLIICPCHRVIGSNGSLTGFALGLPIKQQLLDLEHLHRH